MSDHKEVHHVRIADEAQSRSDHPRRLLHRTVSNSSMSIHSTHSRVAAPEAVLPITFRTLSYNITEDLNNGAPLARKDAKQIHDLEKLDWHLVSVDELFQRLSTSPSQGLSVEQVARRTAEYGKNKPSPPPSGLFRKIVGYVFGGFGILLFLGCILVFIAWKPLGDPPAVANLALAIVLAAVFSIQAAFNAWQDWSSSRVMASITTMLPDECMVVRDSKQECTTTTELVPGDIVKIRQGNKLPADVRFIQVSSDAKFDRSILSGESEPSQGTVDSTDNNYLETRNIGLQGTHCVFGTATGVCVATGDNTVFGRIAGLTNKPRHEFTPLQKEILRFVLIIVGFIATVVIVVVVLWAAWLRRDHPNWINVPLLIVSCVSVGIAFVPEGLPVAVAMSLTIGANIMKKNKILCKSLATVETLGSVSVICSDKTGTLTKNEMFVTDCFAGGGEYTEEAARRAIIGGRNTNLLLEKSLDQLRIVGGLCNAAEFDASTLGYPPGQMKMHGDPTDQAILRFSETLGPVNQLRSDTKTLFEIAFNSRNKFMIRIMHSLKAGVEDMLYIKGAPDVLISRCGSILQKDGTTRALSSVDLAGIEAVKDKWSRNGQRVILVAQKPLGSNAGNLLSSSNVEKAVLDEAKENLTFLGLVGLKDPVREEIPSVIKTLRTAGIRIMMVTGDFKLTAQAIAIDCGIIKTPPALIHGVDDLARDFVSSPEKGEETFQSIVVSGPELTTLNQNQWKQLCKYQEVVFSRTTPEQKLRIVKEFQADENIVSMTGDGVNDAPALKAADVGVALGSGSDIAIEAADMVLLDSFSAIVEAVRYGRVVFDNLKKTIIYLLPAGSFSEFWPVMANVALGVPQVLSSFLMVCLFTDAAGAITLAYEKPESDILLRPPRVPKRDRLVNSQLILYAYGFIGVFECALSFIMAFWYMERRGIPFSAMALKYGSMDPKYDPDYVTEITNKASSIYFVNLVVMQFFNLLAIRTRRLSLFQQPPIFNKETNNPAIFIAMVFALCIVFIFCYIPSLQNSVATTSVPVEYFFLPVAFGLILLVLDETRKYCVRRWPKGILARIAW
ncbi:uncharacterized protein PADG_07481 [Paracoccidioides brasiliensis Pb18]|uniref:Cation-transporting P-type ATPase N-terminal domain-containing protein n=1 Tax=Paracoccidioides brasiliensis (strain Pb18) TaxID=502780 RepID=C1GJP5_PARBD|nr:uncharacterized protein PADG_07481 [Paracoccidioides brasiliensis Pb18]EEH42661.2 hypothetical protein PADG_07481 [Paracoccidioides brasiliensis Pb18]